MVAVDDEAGGVGQQAGAVVEYLQPCNRLFDQLVGAQRFPAARTSIRHISGNIGTFRVNGTLRRNVTMRTKMLLVLAVLYLGAGTALADRIKDDVFRGKLFAPDIIMEHQTELDITKQQFTAIRQAVVEVQSGIAEHEWDMRQAYQALMRELDKSPIDEAQVMKHANSALAAENQVKRKQIMMLVRLKNLLTAEQIAYLESVVTKR